MNEFMLSLLLSTKLFAFIQMFVDYKNIISYNTGVTVVLKFLKFPKFQNCPEIVLKLQIVLKF